MIKRYSFGKSRFQRSQMEGFSYQGGNSLMFIKDMDNHSILLPPLDSGSNNTCWGRLSFLAKLPQNAVNTIYAIATNEKEIKVKNKKKWIKENGIVIAGHRNILLYELKGRYLWCYIEVLGSGEGSLSEIFVEVPGDNFMVTFPEIYQEEGSFLHRYLSIFSTMYNDYQKKIEESWKYLDVEEAPSELLVLYAQWLGLSIEGEILEDNVLRNLLKNLYALYTVKGTKKSLKELVKILVDKDCIIVERNRLGNALSREEEKIVNHLYGNKMQNITLMIKQKAEEKTQAKLLFFLKQFLPIRCSLNLVFYGDCSNMDSYCYLDLNAKLHKTPKGSLDEQKLLDESILKL